VDANRCEKGQLLDEFCALAGYTRKHALDLLRNPPAKLPAWTGVVGRRAMDLP
jgi:hypothetical protein